MLNSLKKYIMCDKLNNKRTLNVDRLLSLQSSSQLVSCSQLILFLIGLSKPTPPVKKNSHSSELISVDSLTAIINENSSLSYKNEINRLFQTHSNSNNFNL